MMVLRQVTRLLSMPASLRQLLFTRALPPRWRATCIQTRCLTVSHRQCAKHRPMRKPLTVGAFSMPHSPTLPLAAIPISELLASPKAGKSLADELEALFVGHPPTFYHGTPDFYTLKKNTRIPEICILGRSNVGKSTLVNGLANKRGSQLALTSSKAGKTRTMNAYAFGPPPTRLLPVEGDTPARRTEDLPTHSLFLVDMPGYGHRSIKDWGHNISLYLTKRCALKGAVLLIDGEVGPKDDDRKALELLSHAAVKTTIVLTKSDKAKDEAMLQKTCQRVWDIIRTIQTRDPNNKWMWEKDIFVTCLGATKDDVGAQSAAVARLAVARMAGLVREKKRPEQEAAEGWRGKVVSFQDLFGQGSEPTAPEDDVAPPSANPRPPRKSKKVAVQSPQSAAGDSAEGSSACSPTSVADPTASPQPPVGTQGLPVESPRSAAGDSAGGSSAFPATSVVPLTATVGPLIEAREVPTLPSPELSSVEGPRSAAEDSTEKSSASLTTSVAPRIADARAPAKAQQAPIQSPRPSASDLADRSSSACSVVVPLIASPGPPKEAQGVPRLPPAGYPSVESPLSSASDSVEGLSSASSATSSDPSAVSSPQPSVSSDAIREPQTTSPTSSPIASCDAMATCLTSSDAIESEPNPQLQLSASSEPGNSGAPVRRTLHSHALALVVWNPTPTELTSVLAVTSAISSAGSSNTPTHTASGGSDGHEVVWESQAGLNNTEAEVAGSELASTADAVSSGASNPQMMLSGPQDSLESSSRSDELLVPVHDKVQSHVDGSESRGGLNGNETEVAEVVLVSTADAVSSGASNQQMSLEIRRESLSSFSQSEQPLVPEHDDGGQGLVDGGRSQGGLDRTEAEVPGDVLTTSAGEVSSGACEQHVGLDSFQCPPASFSQPEETLLGELDNVGHAGGAETVPNVPAYAPDSTPPPKTSPTDAEPCPTVDDSTRATEHSRHVANDAQRWGGADESILSDEHYRREVEDAQRFGGPDELIRAIEHSRYEDEDAGRTGGPDELGGLADDAAQPPRKMKSTETEVEPGDGRFDEQGQNLAVETVNAAVEPGQVAQVGESVNGAAVITEHPADVGASERDSVGACTEATEPALELRGPVVTEGTRDSQESIGIGEPQGLDKLQRPSEAPDIQVAHALGESHRSEGSEGDGGLQRGLDETQGRRESWKGWKESRKPGFPEPPRSGDAKAIMEWLNKDRQRRSRNLAIKPPTQSQLHQDSQKLSQMMKEFMGTLQSGVTVRDHVLDAQLRQKQAADPHPPLWGRFAPDPFLDGLRRAPDPRAKLDAIEPREQRLARYGEVKQRRLSRLDFKEQRDAEAERRLSAARARLLAQQRALSRKDWTLSPTREALKALESGRDPDPMLEGQLGDLPSEWDARGPADARERRMKNKMEETARARARREAKQMGKRGRSAPSDDGSDEDDEDDGFTSKFAAARSGP